MFQSVHCCKVSSDRYSTQYVINKASINDGENNDETGHHQTSLPHKKNYVFSLKTQMGNSSIIDVTFSVKTEYKNSVIMYSLPIC